ncbi:DUF3347 domain-containing protein [uncultured Formosa sp.]|uniref:DUF3347 domain-containing protein n=1 Tax=uncultured Formosa sp. TaxID=255435 RepID=UPI002631D42B|nr:DUF3347 domain-containing protein [uncultured Formosa sp.]
MKNVKQIISITVLAIALFSVVSCKNETKEAGVAHQEVAEADVKQSSPEFKDAAVAATFQHYLHLKTALVKTDAVDAKQGAELIANTTENPEVKALATRIALESDIAKQREQFSDLTTLLKPILVASLASGEIYEQNCPMALKGGANWFAVEKQINNPYYGDKMLRCGIVESTLK